MIDALIINIGSNSGEKNRIAPIRADGRFEYWPIQENEPGPRTPRFKDLNLACPYPNLHAHYDPRFEPTATYGDVRDVKAFKEMAESVRAGRSPLLLFAATLRSDNESHGVRWIVPGIGYYVIGFFSVRELRFAENGRVMDWRHHEHNAHYLRPRHDAQGVKVLVGGIRESRLLERPFPISVRTRQGLQPSPWLKRHFRELRGGPISNGPWFRRSLRNATMARPKGVLGDLLRHEEAAS